ncbi:hypothetical protein [Rhodoplanes roseus]|uniref:Cytochrome c domain-containing protein n=1 Tax=Rhodoplanes roseus TaxID=29409 RepID=A0A327KIX0_9BRAD|nr:hypothetical protein [Rhodoplanes roseus]RAI37583.1 hypothetical protein CH341_29385 [Rhodoplanes roseus]
MESRVEPANDGPGARAETSPHVTLRRGCATALALAALLLVPTTASAQSPPSSEIEAAAAMPITVSPFLPGDVPGGAPNADLATAAAFAWQEFIALSWPAQSGVRETPDLRLPFGTNGVAGGPPLVWQTFRHKVEIFPPRDMNNISAPLPLPHGADRGPPTYGYDLPPDYVYVPDKVGTPDGRVRACPGQAPVAQVPYVNLDETSQIGLDQMFAGILPARTGGANTAPQLIRFMAKGSRLQYVYSLRNEYWYHSAALQTAEQNFIDAVKTGTPPKAPFVFFPVGTIELKSAWRPLAPGEDASRFHTTRVRFYETAGAVPCYVEAEWALIALHIIHKTPTAPAFVFATFEQADNILTVDGRPVEDADGRVIAPQAGYPTEPPQTYSDAAAGPKVALAPGAGFCTGPQQMGRRLFYSEISGNTALPVGGAICVKQRFHDIPPVIVAVNTVAHRAIAAYTAANDVPRSPWAYYKLVNVQAYPFDKSQIATNPNSPKGAPSFYQANGVVETDYTLQNFNGRLSGGAPTDYAPNGTVPNFKNVHLFSQNPPSAASYNMGGCQGCHANAQLLGTDFSFILDGNGFQAAPDAPGPATAAAAAERYELRFRRVAD